MTTAAAQPGRPPHLERADYLTKTETAAVTGYEIHGELPLRHSHAGTGPFAR
jgi:hypothetical protein